jgi:hypothetical protein
VAAARQAFRESKMGISRSLSATRREAYCPRQNIIVDTNLRCYNSLSRST